MSTETRGRLRFKDFSIERLSSGQCQARVVLAWPGEATGLSPLRPVGRPGVPVGAGNGLPGGGVRLGRGQGGASLRRDGGHSLPRATHGRLDGPRVVGSALVQDHVPRGAALAVLNATNRLMTGSSEARR